MEIDNLDVESIIGVNECKSEVLGNSESTGEWDTASTDTLVLHYVHYIQIFRGNCDILRQTKWQQIACQLSRTTKECKKHIDQLQTKYLTELLSKQLNPNIDIEWPYFDIFDKIANVDTDLNVYGPIENIQDDDLRNVDPVNITILEYYIKLKHLFNIAQFGGEMRLWSELGKQIGLSSENCAHRLRVMKYLYAQLKDFIRKPAKYYNLNKVDQYMALCFKAFELPVLKEVKTVTKAWQHFEVETLIEYYSMNYDNVHGKPIQEAWCEVAKKLERSQRQCHSKMAELRKRHLFYRKKKNLNPSAEVCWRYYSRLDEIYEKHNQMTSTVNFFHNYLKQNGNEDEEKCTGDTNRVVAIEQENTRKPKNRNLRTAKPRWGKRKINLLLRMFKSYVHNHRHEGIDQQEMWNVIGVALKISPEDCKSYFNSLVAKYDKCIEDICMNENIEWNLFSNVHNIMSLKPKFKEQKINEVNEEYSDDNTDKTLELLKYYLENMEEFLSPKYNKSYVWNDLDKDIKCCGGNERKFRELKCEYLQAKKNNDTGWKYYEILELIRNKEVEVKEGIKNDPIITHVEQKAIIGYDYWEDAETNKLLTWFLQNLNKFQNPKYKKLYLWRQVRLDLGFSPSRCRKKMSDLRIEYRKKLRLYLQGVRKAGKWKFFGMLQQIYGTDLKNPLLGKTKRKLGP